MQFPDIVTRKLKFPFFLVVLFPGIVTRNLINFRVLLLGYCQFPGNNTQKFDNFQLPGNNTWKLTKRQKCCVNFQVTIPGYFQFQSIVTRKLINFRVTIPGTCTISGRKLLWKNTTFVNISPKTKIFSKIFKGVNLGSRYYGFMKKTKHQKSHASVPLNQTCQHIILLATITLNP